MNSSEVFIKTMAFVQHTNLNTKILMFNDDVKPFFFIFECSIRLTLSSPFEHYHVITSNKLSTAKFSTFSFLRTLHFWIFLFQNGINASLWKVSKNYKK